MKKALITLAKSRRVLEVDCGSNLMQSLLAADLPVASSCHGDGVCAKCRIQVIGGAANLSPENDLEKFLREKFALRKNVRISCQTQVLGDVEIDATYW